LRKLRCLLWGSPVLLSKRQQLRERVALVRIRHGCVPQLAAGFDRAAPGLIPIEEKLRQATSVRIASFDPSPAGRKAGRGNADRTGFLSD